MDFFTRFEGTPKVGCMLFFFFNFVDSLVVALSSTVDVFFSLIIYFFLGPRFYNTLCVLCLALGDVMRNF